MSPSRPFILRPVATVLLMLAILLTGAVAYIQLSVSALPEVDYPTIQVQTFYPGASPEVTASSVTAPLERQFGQVPGLNQMTSSSSGGCSVITLQFSLDLNIDVAEQEVQAAINSSGTYLPKDLPNPPIYNKINPADTPILTLALSSKTMELSEIEDLADTRFAQKISQQPGVGLVSISGGQKPAVRVQVNPTLLAQYGLNIDDIRSAIIGANVNQAKGTFDGLRQSYTIGANDQLLTSAQYRPLIMKYHNGAPVVLSDVADVIDGTEDDQLAAWMNKTPAVIVNIQRQPGANIIDVVDRVNKLLPQLKQSLPAAIEINTLTDRTNTIRASVDDVKFEMVLTICLVVMVIFVFLRNIPATVIPSVAVPLSLIGTFGVMYLLGYSLNNLTLMALTISTGFVVDDAIVMIENISRFIEEGESPLEAALKGSEQIGFTIVSLSVSLIAVLIPLLFMGDVVGRLFREFAVTLAVTILVSAVVSLTLTPMMCSRLLRHKPASQQGRLYRASERAFEWIIETYGKTLTVVLRHQYITLFHRSCDAGRDDPALHLRAERVLPGSRHRRDHRRLRSAANRLICIDERAAAETRQCHSAGPGGGEFVVVHRNRWNQYHPQQRTHPNQPEARRRTRRQLQRHHSSVAAEAGNGGGDHALHAARAGPDGGRPREPHAVSVQPGRSGRERAGDLGAAIR